MEVARAHDVGPPVVLDLGDDVTVNASGGALKANPIMATGLIRVAEAAHQITKHGRSRTLAHVTGGLDAWLMTLAPSAPANPR